MMFRRFVVLTAASLGMAAAADIRVVEEIVAKVNGDIITRGEIERSRQQLAAELRQQGVTGPKLQAELEDKQKDALRDQIDQLLLVQRGKDLSINIDPEVTRRLAEIQKQSTISDPDKFQAYLREQTGMAFEDFKSQMKNQLLTQRVIGQEVSSRIAVPEAEKKKYYEEHKTEFVRQEQVFLRQILISTEGKNPDQVAAAEKKAKDLVGRARKGEKFGELARDNSDDPETSKNLGRAAAVQARRPAQGNRRCGLQAKEGLRHRPDQSAERFSDPARGRALRSGTGSVRGSGERNYRTAGDAQDAAEGARIPDGTAPGRLPGNKGRVRG